MQEQPERKLRRLLGVRAVEAATGLKRTALDEAIKRGEVPAPIRPTLSKTSRRWFEDEIIAYQETRAAARGKPRKGK
jgi:predicted DNA-binding transcriptional regulator AlpA